MFKFLSGVAAGLVLYLVINRGVNVEYSDGSEIMVRPAFKKYLDQKARTGVKLPFIDVPENYANNVEKRVLNSLRGKF